MIQIDASSAGQQSFPLPDGPNDLRSRGFPEKLLPDKLPMRLPAGNAAQYRLRAAQNPQALGGLISVCCSRPANICRNRKTESSDVSLNHFIPSCSNIFHIFPKSSIFSKIFGFFFDIPLFPPSGNQTPVFFSINAFFYLHFSI
jgi:hypothetical protein